MQSPLGWLPVGTGRLDWWPNMNKVTLEAYNACVDEFQKSDCNQRFGQYFCNKFDITDPEVFYADKDIIAVGIILDKYVDWA